MAVKKPVNRSIRERFNDSDVKMSAVLSIVFLLHVLTFKTFFFINPFSAVTTWLAFEQMLSMIGWVLLIVAPPVVLLYRDKLPAFSSLFFISWGIWPIAVILIRISLLISTGNAFVAYLGTYPIFIFTDVIVPIIYIVIWRRLRKS